MTLVDRFICRREGHRPSMRIVKTSGIKVASVITTCQRCGKTYEIRSDDQTTGKELGE